MSGFGKGMSGRLHSIPTEGSLSHKSCSLALFMSSPATFQTMMNDIFHNMIAEGVVCVYLDDILIFTKMLSEHWTITLRVLECLQEYNLCLKPEKCKFKHTQIEYLRVIVSEGMVEMDLVKVSGVLEWPEPWNKREVQSL